MINVALDSNIYRKKPRLDSPEFRALVFLAKNECICLHIPYFVEHEFKSQLEIEQDRRLGSVLTTLAKIVNYSELGPKTLALHDIADSLSSSRNEIVAECGNSFIEWASEINANRYSLSEEETNDAVVAYFQGTPPLKEPKVRKDIPDSFIYQSLLRINHKTPLCVVIEDGKLREACSAAGMTCYAELASFIESKDVKSLLQGKIDNDVLNAIESQIVEYLGQNQDLLIDHIEEKLLSGEYTMISGDYIPGESNEIYVSGVNKPHKIQIGTSIEHYGDALFVVDFIANVELLYEYAVYKSEALELDPKKFHLEYLNDHYFNVETTDEFSFKGRIELNFDISLEAVESVTELFNKLSEPEVSIEELDDFEIIE